MFDMTITLQHYLFLSVTLFVMGLIGVASRRNMITVLLCIVVMLMSACIAMLAFARWNLLPDGKVMALFIVAIAAAISTFGLSVLLAVYKKKKSVLVE